ncbi:MAG TPA: alpha/beta hydrolase [Gemmatimonadaceae bacterium]|nr:alpha/beta hydrolase [Gemmatimonadaceae bacterium]
MTSKSKIAFTAATVATLAATPVAQAQHAVAKPDTSGYVAANGIDYWFEIRGKGEPLLLLHGGLFTTELFGPVLTKLAENHRVIGIHLQGHGRTALGARKINLVDIGRDLGVVLPKLGLKQVDVMGYSFGGGAAFQLAAQHPELVRRLVLVSTPYAQSGFFPEMLPQQAAVGAAMADAMKDTPMYKAYVAVAPHPQDFPKLLDAMGEYMRQPYDWSATAKQLTMPVMLVYGDADMIRPEHAVSFFQLLGGGLKDAGWMREHMSKNRLAIVPNMTHYEIGAAPLLATTVLPFLNGESDTKNPAEQARK